MGGSWLGSAPGASALAFGLAALVWSGSAQALREDTRGLLADVERIVSVEQSLGWFVDRRAYEEVLPATLQSVCRADPAARIEARTELERRARELGDSRALFARAGRELDGDTKEALFVERQLGALNHAMDRASVDCPFYVEPEPDFIGRQTDRNRFTLSLETGGMLQLRRTEGDWTFGGGGTARLLPGWGFGGAVTLLAGAEFGGGAMIRLVEDGDHGDCPSAERAQQFLLELPPGPIGDDDAQVRAVERRAGSLHAQFPEVSHVIDACGIDEEDRAQGEQFHRLLDRIGGRSGVFGDDGHLLACYGIEKTGLAHVPSAEEADVKAKSFRGTLHRNLPFHS